MIIKRAKLKDQRFAAYFKLVETLERDNEDSDVYNVIEVQTVCKMINPVSKVRLHNNVGSKYAGDWMMDDIVELASDIADEAFKLLMNDNEEALQNIDIKADSVGRFEGNINIRVSKPSTSTSNNKSTQIAKFRYEGSSIGDVISNKPHADDSRYMTFAPVVKYILNVLDFMAPDIYEEKALELNISMTDIEVVYAAEEPRKPAGKDDVELVITEQLKDADRIVSVEWVQGNGENKSFSIKVDSLLPRGEFLDPALYRLITNALIDISNYRNGGFDTCCEFKQIVLNRWGNVVVIGDDDYYTIYEWSLSPFDNHNQIKVKHLIPDGVLYGGDLQLIQMISSMLTIGDDDEEGRRSVEVKFTF